MYANITLTAKQITETFGIPSDVAKQLENKIVPVHHVRRHEEDGEIYQLLSHSIFEIHGCDGVEFAKYYEDFSEKMAWGE